MPWNFFFPSGVFRSHGIIFEPTRSCNIMDAVTIGPMPSVIRLPIEDPRISS